MATDRTFSAFNTAVKRGAAIDADIQATAGSISATELASTLDLSSKTVTLPDSAVQATSTARTATDDGTTTGTIADGTRFVTVDADSDANHIIILPTPTPGHIVYLTESGTTGFELRSSAPATVAINGGTGAGAESAIAGAATLVKCVCISATAWMCNYLDADGDEAKVEAAA